MTIRAIVTFTRPFRLNAFDGELPPGSSPRMIVSKASPNRETAATGSI